MQSLLALVAVGLGMTMAADVPAGLMQRLTESLQPIMDNKSAYWNHSAISMTLYAPNRNLTLTLGSGMTDKATKAHPDPETRYLFGSATKMFTATEILRLVERGELSLNNTADAQPLIDQSLDKLNQTSLLKLGFNEEVANITIRHLLSMHSGIYDLPEQLRDWQNARPLHDFGPVELLSLTNKALACHPGECGEYSDVNYILLGLILMAKQNASSWQEVLQNTSIPSALNLNSTEFAHEGPLSTYRNAANGYQPDGSDVYSMSALSGWTCGNILTTTSNMAKFVFSLYNAEECKGPNRVVSCSTVLEMLKFQQLSVYFPVWYGLGTMALYPDLWGHGGATYGFYSFSGYNPYLEFSLVVSINQETLIFQEDLWDVHRPLYNTIKQALNTTQL